MSNYLIRNGNNVIQAVIQSNKNLLYTTDNAYELDTLWEGSITSTGNIIEIPALNTYINYKLIGIRLNKDNVILIAYNNIVDGRSFMIFGGAQVTTTNSTQTRGIEIIAAKIGITKGKLYLWHTGSYNTGLQYGDILTLTGVYGLRPVNVIL